MKFNIFLWWKWSCNKQITNDIIKIVARNIKINIPFIWEKTLEYIIDDYLNFGELTTKDNDSVYKIIKDYLDWWEIITKNWKNYITYPDNWVDTWKRFSSIIWAIVIWYNYCLFWEKENKYDEEYKNLISIWVAIKEMLNWQNYQNFIDSVKKYIQEENIDTKVNNKEVFIDWQWICLDLIQYKIKSDKYLYNFNI